MIKHRQALEKAKEAGRKERAAVKLREQLNLMDQVNLDLTFNVSMHTEHTVGIMQTISLFYNCITLY